MQFHILSPEQGLFIKHGVCGHADGDQQVGVRVQVNHLNVLHRDVPRANGTVNMLQNLHAGKKHNTAVDSVCVVFHHLLHKYICLLLKKEKKENYKEVAVICK